MIAVYTTKSRTYAAEYRCTEQTESVLYQQTYNDNERQLDRNYAYLLACHTFATTITQRIHDMYILAEHRDGLSLVTLGIHPMADITLFLDYLQREYSTLKNHWRGTVDGVHDLLTLSRLLELVGTHFQSYIHEMTPLLNHIVYLLHHMSSAV